MNLYKLGTGLSIHAASPNTNVHGDPLLACGVNDDKGGKNKVSRTAPTDATEVTCKNCLKFGRIYLDDEGNRIGKNMPAAPTLDTSAIADRLDTTAKNLRRIMRKAGMTRTGSRYELTEADFDHLRDLLKK